MAKTRPIPDSCHTLTAHLVVNNARQAIEFYKKAFGARELGVMPTPDGQFVVHAELEIGDSRLMLCDEMPMMESCRSPQSLGGTSVTIHLWSEDVDAAFQRAIQAGATVSMPLMDAFWGDRYGKLKDPFGHEWSMATHIKDMSPEEIKTAAEAAFAQMGG